MKHRLLNFGVMFFLLILSAYIAYIFIERSDYDQISIHVFGREIDLPLGFVLKSNSDKLPLKYVSELKKFPIFSVGGSQLIQTGYINTPYYDVISPKRGSLVINKDYLLVDNIYVTEWKLPNDNDQSYEYTDVIVRNSKQFINYSGSKADWGRFKLLILRAFKGD